MRPQTTRARTSISSASRRRRRTSASAGTSGISAGSACSVTSSRPRSRQKLRTRCVPASPRRRQSRIPIRSCCSTTRTSSRRRTYAKDSMTDRLLVEAVNDALHVELARDESVMVMGEDVGRAGGVFRATAGLRDRFGENRCVDTPLAEAGILGAAVGLCMAGWRPGCEMQYDAFSYPCLDQLITHVGRYRWRTGGKMEFPITVRMPYGGGVRAPELHG